MFSSVSQGNFISLSLVVFLLQIALSSRGTTPLSRLRLLDVQLYTLTCSGRHGSVSEPLGISQQDATFTFTAFRSLLRRTVCVPAVGDWVWLTADWLVLKTCERYCKNILVKPPISALGPKSFLFLKQFFFHPAQIHFFSICFPTKKDVFLTSYKDVRATQVGHFLQQRMKE